MAHTKVVRLCHKHTATLFGLSSCGTKAAVDRKSYIAHKAGGHERVVCSPDTLFEDRSMSHRESTLQLGGMGPAAAIEKC